MSEENIPSENSKKEILNSKQEEVTKNISQQETIEQTETQPETQNTKLETENMEVHHHPHVEKKNFKEYFLEFLMIFLAVTLGFFAENIREHFVNSNKEKEFITSLKEDLRDDTTQLSFIIPVGNVQYEKLDSLYTLMRLLSEQQPVNINRLYYLNFEYSFGLVFFRPNKRTISQIKNTGTFSLITNKRCRDSITIYDYINEEAIQINSDTYENWLSELNKMSEKIFNYDNIKTFGFTGGADVYLDDSLQLNLLTTDKTVLNEYANKIRSVMMILEILINTEQAQLKRCKNLINILNKEYHLSN